MGLATRQYSGDRLLNCFLPAEFSLRFVMASKRFLLAACLIGAWIGMQENAVRADGKILFQSDFETSTPADNPWMGVSGQGLIKGVSGQQLAVDDEGKIGPTDFGPSVAVGDLNGDKLTDLVVADSHGFIWFFPNSGTANVPKFTHGEIIPIWFGIDYLQPDYLGGSGESNIISKIQLVDLAGDGKRLDLVVGNYVGRLYYMRNQGSSDRPYFIMPENLHTLLIPTRRDGQLWTNFLSPFLFDWSKTGALDLIMGDGSYSANSIYLFTNQGGRDKPVFNEGAMKKIIPGMGLEDLTPQVVDWNNDGKPDIITGERTGHLVLFTNTSTDPQNPTFDAGQNIKLGSLDNFGGMTTVTVCDLNANKLPNLIITNSEGQIFYAQNKGKLGSPSFGDPIPIAGEKPPPGILKSTSWNLSGPNGIPNELLVVTNKDVEKGFLPPPATPFKSALRYYVYPVHNVYFPKPYYPKFDGAPYLHTIAPVYGSPGSSVILKPGKPYTLSFWMRASGPLQNLTAGVGGYSTWMGDNNNAGKVEEFDLGNPVAASDTWTQFSFPIRYHLKKTQNPNAEVSFTPSFTWQGQGQIYLDGVTITEGD